MILNPITRVILQTEDGYYSMPWDATCGLTINPGWGNGTATHNGTIYSLNAADPAAASARFTNPTPVPAGWTALTLGAGDNIRTALAARGANAVLSLAGDFLGQRVMLPDDEGLVIEAGSATGIEFFR